MSYSKKIYFSLFCIATIIGILTLVIFGGYLSEEPKHIMNLVIDVEYLGFWKIEIQDCGGFYTYNSMSVSSRRIPIQSPRSDLWIGEITVYKMDGTRNLLIIRLLLEDGSILTQSSTDVSYGVAKVNFSFKYDPTINDYCPILN